MKTKYIHNIRYCFLLLIAFPYLAFATDGGRTLTKLQNKLQKYLDTRTEETVYIKTDKPFYANGEDIWLTAFVLNAATYKPTDISDAVYVVLKDPKGNDVERIKLPMVSGVAKGDFRLKADAAGGIYTLVGYTQWMQNWGEDRFFKKEIHVQKVITPNLLLKPDFEKKAYGASDEVVTTLKVTDLENRAAAGASVKAHIAIGGNLINTLDVRCDNGGEATIKFFLPSDLTTTDGTINMVVNHKGIEESVSRTIPIVLNKIQLSFYPEGGYLINNFTSRLAFEGLNEFGKGADISGEIVDENGTQITTFDSYHSGMGAIPFTPKVGEKYYARILRPTSNTELIPLPYVTDRMGLSLIAQSNDNLTWSVYSPTSGKAILTLQVHGIMQYSQEVELEKGINQLKTPTKELQAGIAVATLFDDNGIEQSERLVFVNNQKVLNISITSDKAYYKPGEKVSLVIKTKDHNRQAIPARLSLSVVDDRLLTFADDKQDNILSSFLLSSELKGAIEEPSFYFDPDKDKASKAIDYLLLTHGWRRFTWEEVSAEIKAPIILPENRGTIAGFITNSQGKAKAGSITLVEQVGKKRIKTIETGSEGQFVFHNTDPTSDLALLTDYPNHVHIWIPPAIDKLDINKPLFDTPASLQLSATESALPDRTVSGRSISYPNGDKSVSESQQGAYHSGGGGGALMDMVVVSYGAPKFVDFHKSERIYWSTASELESLLGGQHTIIDVPIENANVGAAKVTSQNKAALYDPNSKMLMVVDGIPMNERINDNLTMTGAFAMNDLSLVGVLSSIEAVNKYGMKAVYGAIEVVTKGGGDFPRYKRPVFRKPKFNGIEVGAIDDYYHAREYYTPVKKANQAERSDFRTTIFWAGQIATNQLGVAEVSFLNNDATSAFKITAEGLNQDGLIGRATSSFSTVMPLSLDAKIPHYMNHEDRVHIPVTVKNTSNKVQECILTLKVDDNLSVVGDAIQHSQIESGRTETIYFSIASKKRNGKYPLTIELTGDCLDKIKHEIIVQDVGFPRTLSLSGNTSRDTLFTFDKVIPGSFEAKTKLNTDIFDDLLSGAQSIIKQPHGCFEQATASNYPNILAMKAMQSMNKRDDVKEMLLNEYLDRGYRLLTSYEIEGGGFEWFGRPPAHTALTACGLIQFHELNQVWKGVDANLLKRTHTFLMNQRKGDGTFNQERGKFGFSAANENITNAYITYVLAEVDTKDILPEYEHALNEALASKDMYRMALMANAAFNLGKMNDYEKLADLFCASVKGSGINKMKVEGTLVHSATGRLEATALWVVALMKSQDKYMPEITSCINYISQYRQGGGFGSTQATALCLKALTLYAEKAKSKLNDGWVDIGLNDGREVLSFEKGSIDQSFFDSNIRTGKNKLTCTPTSHKESYSYSVDLSWKVSSPEKHSNCPLVLTTKMDKTAKVNETVRLSISMENKQNKGQSMSMIEVGIPAGLSLNPIQLKELRDKDVYDFYEIFDNRLVIYYRELGPMEKKEINLDLKAEIAGSYTGGASCTYLYYRGNERYWIDGLMIEVKLN